MFYQTFMMLRFIEITECGLYDKKNAIMVYCSKVHYLSSVNSVRFSKINNQNHCRIFIHRGSDL